MLITICTIFHKLLIQKTQLNVFLFNKNASFEYLDDDIVLTNGLGEKWDKKTRDLIRIIKIKDPLNIKYEKTNILTPLMFAESSTDIPWHFNTQGMLFTRVSKNTLKWIKSEIKKDRYGKHEFDKFWLPFCKDIEQVKPGEVLCVFNRRISGWDGSYDRPVIELLGAGGHVPTMWNRKDKCFYELDIKKNFQKEFSEELGGKIDKDGIVIFGGYQNDATHELVALCGIELKDSQLKSLQDYAIQNIDDNTQGIYLGTFDETMDYYRKNPTPFAGGDKAAPYNFPNRLELMKKVEEYFASLNDRDLVRK